MYRLPLWQPPVIDHIFEVMADLSLFLLSFLHSNVLLVFLANYFTTLPHMSNHFPSFIDNNTLTMFQILNKPPSILSAIFPSIPPKSIFLIISILPFIMITINMFIPLYMFLLWLNNLLRIPLTVSLSYSILELAFVEGTGFPFVLAVVVEFVVWVVSEVSVTVGEGLFALAVF